MTKLRILVCGGRHYNDAAALYRALDAVHAKRGIAAIIEGGATGADTLAHQWAKQRRVPVESYPADWRKYGHVAGPVRNAQMLREAKPDGVVAFPGGAGTADMVAKAEAAGVKVWKVGEKPR